MKELDDNYITVYFDRVNGLILIESMKLIKLRSITLISMTVSTKKQLHKGFSSHYNLLMDLLFTSHKE